MKSNCISCGKEFTYNPSQKRGKYCSNKCQGFHQRKLKVEAGKSTVRPLRQYLIERDIYECVMCGNDGNWMGNPLALQLDHIDGNPKNNTLDNVRWLCPNCHCQTETWGSNNIAEENRHKLATNVLL